MLQIFLSTTIYYIYIFTENNKTYGLLLCLYSRKIFFKSMYNTCRSMCMCKFVTVYLKATELIIIQCKHIFSLFTHFGTKIYFLKIDLKDFPFFLISSKNIFEYRKSIK